MSQGDGFKKIADTLKSQGLIRSAGAFKLFSFFSGSAHRLKPGEYSLSPILTTPDIVRRLVAGIPEDVKVLIPEGATLKEIDERLSGLGIITKGALSNFSLQILKEEYPFLEDAQTLEGFLFPDTYRFFPKSDPAQVVKRFLDNWRRQVLPLFSETSVIVYDALIKASIIEKEIQPETDRSVVAGILDRRLKQGIPLQVDATIVYLKCGGAFRNCPMLTRKDFQLDSSFNTYKHIGLPPTPIANPGLVSIRAVLNPTETSFLYYLSDPNTKKTIFAETLDEHNQNRLHYLH